MTRTRTPRSRPDDTRMAPVSSPHVRTHSVSYRRWGITTRVRLHSACRRRFGLSLVRDVATDRPTPTSAAFRVRRVGVRVELGRFRWSCRRYFEKGSVAL